MHHDAANQVTYYSLGCAPMDTISAATFAQLDHVVAQQDWLHCVRDVWSDRLAALQSHHFLTLVDLEHDTPKASEHKS